MQICPVAERGVRAHRRPGKALSRCLCCWGNDPRLGFSYDMRQILSSPPVYARFALTADNFRVGPMGRLDRPKRVSARVTLSGP